MRLDIHFRAELRWPGTIEMGLGVVKFGRTSVTFDQVVFSEGKCVASAQSVSVLIDEATRKPTPLTPEIRREFSALDAPRATTRHDARSVCWRHSIVGAALQPAAATTILSRGPAYCRWRRPARAGLKRCCCGRRARAAIHSP